MIVLCIWLPKPKRQNEKRHGMLRVGDVIGMPMLESMFGFLVCVCFYGKQLASAISWALIGATCMVTSKLAERFHVKGSKIFSR